MRSPATERKPRTSRMKSFPAPTGGWVANRNLATPNAGRVLPGSYTLENWFPTGMGAVLRRGSDVYATLGDGTKPVTALFSYKNGNQEELFGATEDTIYNITTITTAINYFLGTDDGDTIVTDDDDTIGEDSTAGKEIATGLSGGDWIAIQFATSGGVFLVLVNGADDMLVYDGNEWYPINGESLHTLAYDAETTAFTVGEVLTGGTSGATGTIEKIEDDGTTGTLWLRGVSGTFEDNETITDPEGGSADANGTATSVFGAFTGVDTSDLNFVWAFKNRLFFIEDESLSAWYLSVDSLTGSASEIPLGGVFGRGGSLIFGASWSLDSGSGLSEQCVFVTSEGEVAVYQGSNPGEADSWSLVGVYRIGRPLGKKAFIRAGGDIVIATDVGFVPLSQAIKRDYAALSPAAVSYPIEDAWNEAVLERSSGEWNCEVWPSAQMVMVAPPTVNDVSPEVYVANARTGAWAKFTGWNVTALEVFMDRCFFGSEDGKVVEAMVTGRDQGETYTGIYVPLFDDFRSPGSLKIGEMARAVIRAGVAVNDQLTMQKDFSVSLPPVPNATVVPTGSVWGGAIWGESVWGAPSEHLVQQQWRSVGGTGYAVAPALQVTSGSIVPLDAEIVRLDLTYAEGDIVT